MLCVAGCAWAVASGTPRSTGIAWIDGSPGAADRDCPAFDAVARGVGGWWLSGPSCLAFAANGDGASRMRSFRESDWTLDRVDALFAASDGVVWAAGRQRRGEAVRAVLGSAADSGVAVGDPARWGLDGVLVNALAGTEAGPVWAAGRRLGSPPIPFLARHDGKGWTAIDARGLGAGEIVDADFAPDGCGWFVGRDPEGAAVLVRFDGSTLRREVLEPEDGAPTEVAAVSCGDLWLGGRTAIRYAEGHREEITFGGDAEVNGLAACPNGDLLLVGERIAREPEMGGRRVGFSFRVRDGEASSLAVQLPFAVDDWRLADVGCDAGGAWAVGAAIAMPAAGAAPERRALALRLDADGWRFRGWEYR